MGQAVGFECQSTHQLARSQVKQQGWSLQIRSGMLRVWKIKDDERLELCPDSRAPFPPIWRNRLSGMRIYKHQVSGMDGS